MVYTRFGNSIHNVSGGRTRACATAIYLYIVQTAFQSYHTRPRKRRHELREKSSIDDLPRHARAKQLQRRLQQANRKPYRNFIEIHRYNVIRTMTIGFRNTKLQRDECVRSIIIIIRGGAAVNSAITPKQKKTCSIAHCVRG